MSKQEKKPSKDIQKQYLEFQILNQQLQQLQQQAGMIEKQIIELRKLSDNLDSIKQLKGNNELLVPMGAGIFMKAQLKDNSTLLINVGSDVIVKKTFLESKEMLESQLKELEDILENANGQVSELATQLELRSQALQNIEDSLQ